MAVHFFPFYSASRGCIYAMHILLLCPASLHLLYVIFIPLFVILTPAGGSVRDFFLSLLGLPACFFFIGGFNRFFPNLGQNSALILDEYKTIYFQICLFLVIFIYKFIMSILLDSAPEMACAREIPLGCHFLYAHFFPQQIHTSPQTINVPNFKFVIYPHEPDIWFNLLNYPHNFFDHMHDSYLWTAFLFTFILVICWCQILSNIVIIGFSLTTTMEAFKASQRLFKKYHT